MASLRKLFILFKFFFVFADSLTFGQGPQGTFDFEREWKTDKWQDLVGYQNSETESVASRERRDRETHQHRAQRGGQTQGNSGCVRENQHTPQSNL